MIAPRAVWKGFLKVGSVTCGVKIVGATSEASKIHFKILDRKDALPVASVPRRGRRGLRRDPRCHEEQGRRSPVLDLALPARH